jgi:hypothetical protein
MYKNSKFLEYCNLVDNIRITSHSHNQVKSDSIPCTEDNNQSLISIANAIKVDFKEFKHYILLYENDHPDFYAEFNPELAIQNALKSRKTNYTFDDFIS